MTDAISTADQDLTAAVDQAIAAIDRIVDHYSAQRATLQNEVERIDGVLQTLVESRKALRQTLASNTDAGAATTVPPSVIPFPAVKDHIGLTSDDRTATGAVNPASDESDPTPASPPYVAPGGPPREIPLDTDGLDAGGPRRLAPRRRNAVGPRDIKTDAGPAKTPPSNPTRSFDYLYDLLGLTIGRNGRIKTKSGTTRPMPPSADSDTIAPGAIAVGATRSINDDAGNDTTSPTAEQGNSTAAPPNAATDHNVDAHATEPTGLDPHGLTASQSSLLKLLAAERMPPTFMRLRDLYARRLRAQGVHQSRIDENVDRMADEMNVLVDKGLAERPGPRVYRITAEGRAAVDPLPVGR